MTYDGRTRVVVMARPETMALDLIMRDIPRLKQGEALVRIRNAGICGTDLHIICWNAWAAKSYSPPFALGHELCGEIVDLKDTGPFKVGDRVTAETHLACDTCYQCKMGRGHTCDNLRTFSRLDQGAFADYSVVPVKLLRLVPDGLDDRTASVMEPIGIAMRAVKEAACSGEAILVSGCGPIGLFAVAAAKYYGARDIVACDPVSDRRDIAIRMGANVALDPIDQDVVQHSNSRTAGNGVACSVETSGVTSALAGAFRATRKGGRVITAGLPAEDTPIDLAGQIVLREISLHGIYGRKLDETWLDVETAVNSGLNMSEVITHDFELEDYISAIQTAQSGKSGKVVFKL